MNKKLLAGCAGFSGVFGVVLLLLGISLVVLIVGPPVAIRGHAAWQEQLPAKKAAPPYGTYVRAHDIDMHVWRHGPEDGPVVVLVHGTSAWSGTWRDTVIDLGKAGYHCIAIDLPPFGFSERPKEPAYSTEDQAKRIIGLLDTLKIEEAALIGHSFGGGATVEAALLGGDRIVAMALIDVALGIDQEPLKSPVMDAILAFPPARDTLVAATFTNPWFIPYGVRSFIYDPDDATPEVLARYTQPFVVEGTTAAIGQWVPELVAPQRPSLSSKKSVYKQLTMPTLVLWGEEDTVTPPAQGKQLAKLLPNSRLEWLPKVGHIPQIEEPERVSKALRRFLRRHHPTQE